MSDSDKDSNELEERLANTETALLYLWSLLGETVPETHRQSIESMMEEYFNTNRDLGGFALNNFTNLK